MNTFNGIDLAVDHGYPGELTEISTKDLVENQFRLMSQFFS